MRTRIRLTIAGVDKGVLVIEVDAADEAAAVEQVEQSMRSGDPEVVTVEGRERILRWSEVVLARPVAPGEGEIGIPM